MDLAKATLDDKYTQETGRVFLTGTQALIRVMLLQRERDMRAGLNTAGFISGYRGSPLGASPPTRVWCAQARPILSDTALPAPRRTRRSIISSGPTSL